MAADSAASSSVTRATVVGTVLQVAMVVAGHFIPAVKDQFALGGVSAFLGILVSTLLKDVPPSLLAMGTAGSAVTGIIGGVLGRFVGQPRG